jgi:phosphopantothenoylcysteine decarboxylase/phosphopantothenate--cysteine ligase
MSLANKNILVGMTGSIAAYKSADLVRRLRDAGATVRVAMTENAKRFITPMTMQAVSGHPVHDELFDLQAEAAMGHIELARWADLILIAPASADLMARLTHGHANDLLTTLCLATRAPIAIAPAMNQGMWQHSVTQSNLQALIEQNVFIIGPGAGSQACGDVGFGRMLEPVEIVEHATRLFKTGLLLNRKVLITAGPTHEAIDPVRYITNGSTGKMGYALAEAAVAAGAHVTLVSGPVQLSVPLNVNCMQVTTALEMHDVVMRNIDEYDMVFAVAAVSDYRCETIAEHKIHKEQAVSELKMVRNPDIAASIGALANKPFLVGFAAETENVLASANAKRKRKNMDMIIANQVSDGMGTDENTVTVISESDTVALPRDSKQKLASKIIEIVAEKYQVRQKEIA